MEEPVDYAKILKSTNIVELIIVVLPSELPLFASYFPDYYFIPDPERKAWMGDFYNQETGEFERTEDSNR